MNVARNRDCRWLLCALFTVVFGATGTASAASPTTSPPAGSLQQGDFVPLTWSALDPVTQYTLPDGTLVTHVGGRTRDRHAREVPPVATTGDPYDLFAAHYFERRSHDLTIYENVSPTNPAARVITIVMRPQWYLYGTNFREGFIGRRNGDLPGPTAVALYGDNGGMKRLPPFSLMSGQELQTPLANYNQLPGDPPHDYLVDPATNISVNLGLPLQDGEFVLVKQIASSPPYGRAPTSRNYLIPGDLVEFELGIFLAGPQGSDLGRFNYYSEALVYEVGKPGVHSWYRGPCCDGSAIPWNSHLTPESALSGGPMMTLQEDTDGQPGRSFQQAGTNIAGRNIQPFLEGRRLFHTSFLTGSHTEPGNPPFTTEAGKAGPKFQQAACVLCHVNNGKSTPGLNVPLNNMVVLTADVDASGQLLPDARFGGHLEQGLVVENKVTYDGRQALLTIDAYNTVEGIYADNTSYTLQTPHYLLADLTGKSLPLPARMSVRAAPHMAGMGLLEAVPESELQALATASRTDPDGAVGKLQIVPDLQDPAITRVGRFGWRATVATVAQQTATALNGDMGVTTTMLPHHLCGLAIAPAGADCRAADAKGSLLSDDDLDLLTKYVSLLGIPPQRHFAGEQPVGIPAPTLVSQPAATTAAEVQAENDLQSRVVRGGTLFGQIRCNACHVQTLTTGTAHRFAELRSQTIHAYTDMLLHDMGPELADNFPQGNASGQEWRTAPLWGLGLLSSINPNVRYLHDGRARGIEEAILWHAGQGAKSRDRFKQLTAADRQDLIEFVNSL